MLELVQLFLDKEDKYNKFLPLNKNKRMKVNEKINGEDAFRLYDTYGFPIDLTILMAKEKNLSVDINSFCILFTVYQYY